MYIILLNEIKVESLTIDSNPTFGVLWLASMMRCSDKFFTCLISSISIHTFLQSPMSKFKILAELLKY